MNMNVSNVDSLLAQMRAAMAAAQGQPAQAPAATGGADFANVLKSSLDGVNQAQHQYLVPDGRAGAQQGGGGL